MEKKVPIMGEKGPLHEIILLFSRRSGASVFTLAPSALLAFMNGSNYKMHNILGNYS